MKTDITQVRSLLVLELMTLQLFYNFQNHTHSHGTDELMSTKAVLFSANNQDMMLRSMEGLLEVEIVFFTNLFTNGKSHEKPGRDLLFQGWRQSACHTIKENFQNVKFKMVVYIPVLSNIIIIHFSAVERLPTRSNTGSFF